MYGVYIMAKSKYNDDFPLLVEGWAREGMKDIDMCKKIIAFFKIN